MPPDEDHVEGSDGPHRGKQESRKYSSHVLTTSSHLLSTPLQQRRFRRSATCCYPHLPKSSLYSLASRGAVRAGVCLPSECGDAGSSFVTGVSSRAASDGSLWTSPSPKSEEYMSACSGACLSSNSGDRGPQCGRRRAFTPPPNLFCPAVSNSFSPDANAACSIFQPSSARERCRLLSVPAELDAAARRGTSSSPFSSGGSWEHCSPLPPPVQLLSSHLIMSPVRGAADVTEGCAAMHEQSARATQGFLFAERRGFCRTRCGHRSASDPLEYEGRLLDCDGSDGGGEVDAERRQVSSPGYFDLPLPPEAACLNQMPMAEASVDYNAPADEGVIQLITRLASSPDSSDLPSFASPRSSPEPPNFIPLHSDQAETPFSLLQRAEDSDYHPIAGAADGATITNFADRRISSWASPVRPSFRRHSRELAKSAECLRPVLSVCYTSEPPAVVQRREGEVTRRTPSDAVSLSPSESSSDAGVSGAADGPPAPVAAAVCQSVSRSTENGSRRSRNFFIVCSRRGNSEIAGGCNGRCCSSKSHLSRRGRSGRLTGLRSSSSYGASGHGDSEARCCRSNSPTSSESACSSCSSSDISSCNCSHSHSHSCSCSRSLSSSESSCTYSRSPSSSKSNQSRSSGGVSADSKFWSPVVLTEADSAFLEALGRQEESDNQSEARSGKGGGACSREISSGEGNSSDAEVFCETDSDGRPLAHLHEGSFEPKAGNAHSLIEEPAEDFSRFLGTTCSEAAGVSGQELLQASLVAQNQLDSAPDTAISEGKKEEPPITATGADACDGNSALTLESQHTDDATGHRVLMAKGNGDVEDKALQSVGAAVIDVASPAAESSSQTSRDGGASRDASSASPLLAACRPVDTVQEAEESNSASFGSAGESLTADCPKEDSKLEDQQNVAAREIVSGNAVASKTKRGALSGFFDPKDKRKRKSCMPVASKLPTRLSSIVAFPPAVLEQKPSAKLHANTQAYSEPSSPSALVAQQLAAISVSDSPFCRQESCGNSQDVGEPAAGKAGSSLTLIEPQELLTTTQSGVSCTDPQQQPFQDSSRQISLEDLLKDLEPPVHLPADEQEALQKTESKGLPALERFSFNLEEAQKGPSVTLPPSMPEESPAASQREGGLLSEAASPTAIGAVEPQNAPLVNAVGAFLSSAFLQTPAGSSGAIRGHGSCADIFRREPTPAFRQFSLPEALEPRGVPPPALAEAADELSEESEDSGENDQTSAGDLELRIGLRAQSARSTSSSGEACPFQACCNSYLGLQESSWGAATPQADQASVLGVSQVQSDFEARTAGDPLSEVFEEDGEAVEGSAQSAETQETCQTGVSDLLHASNNLSPHPENDPDTEGYQDVGEDWDEMLTASADATASDQPTEMQQQGAQDPTSTQSVFEDSDQTSSEPQSPLGSPQTSFQKLGAAGFLGGEPRALLSAEPKQAQQQESALATAQVADDFVLLEQPNIGDESQDTGERSEEGATADNGLRNEDNPQEEWSITSLSSQSPSPAQQDAGHTEHDESKMTRDEVLSSITELKDPQEPSFDSSQPPGAGSCFDVHASAYNEPMQRRAVARCLTDDVAASRGVGRWQRLCSEPAILQSFIVSEQSNQGGSSRSNRRMSHGDIGATEPGADAGNLRPLIETFPKSQMTGNIGNSGQSLLSEHSSVKSEVEFGPTRDVQTVPSFKWQLSLCERVYCLQPEESCRLTSLDTQLLQKQKAAIPAGCPSAASRQASDGQLAEVRALHMSKQGDCLVIKPDVITAAVSTESLLEDGDPFEDAAEDAPEEREDAQPTAKYPSEPFFSNLSNAALAKQDGNPSSSFSLIAGKQFGRCNTLPPASCGGYPKVSRAFSELTLRGLPACEKRGDFEGPTHLWPEEARGDPSDCNGPRRNSVCGGSSGSGVDHQASKSGSILSESSNSGSAVDDGGISGVGSGPRMFAVADSDSSNRGGGGRESPSGDRDASDCDACSLSEEMARYYTVGSGTLGRSTSSLNNALVESRTETHTSVNATATEHEASAQSASSCSLVSSGERLARCINSGAGRLPPDEPPGVTPQGSPSNIDSERLPSSSTALQGHDSARPSSSCFARGPGQLLHGDSNEPPSGGGHAAAGSQSLLAPSAAGLSKPAHAFGFAAAFSSLAHMLFAAKPHANDGKNPVQPQSASSAPKQTESSALVEAKQQGTQPDARPHHMQAVDPLPHRSSKETLDNMNLQSDFDEECENEQRAASLSKEPLGFAVNFNVPTDRFGGSLTTSDRTVYSSHQEFAESNEAFRQQSSAVDCGEVQAPDEGEELRPKTAVEDQPDLTTAAGVLLPRGASNPDIESDSAFSSGRSLHIAGDASEAESNGSSSACPSAEGSDSVDEAEQCISCQPRLSCSSCLSERQEGQVPCAQPSEAGGDVPVESSKSSSPTTGHRDNLVQQHELSETAFVDSRSSAEQASGPSLGFRPSSRYSAPDKKALGGVQSGEAAQRPLDWNGEPKPAGSILRSVRKPGKAKVGSVSICDVPVSPPRKEECQLHEDEMQRECIDRLADAERSIDFQEGTEGVCEGNDSEAAGQPSEVLELESFSGHTGGSLSKECVKRMGIRDANRVLDGIIAHVLRTPRVMQGHQGVERRHEGAKMELLRGEAKKWRAPEAATQAPPAAEAAEADVVLEKPHAFASKAELAKRLALNHPALTCKLPPIFCISESSLWNLQLRRRFSPSAGSEVVQSSKECTREGDRLLTDSKGKKAFDVSSSAAETPNGSLGQQPGQRGFTSKSHNSSGSLSKELVGASFVAPSVKPFTISTEDQDRSSSAGAALPQLSERTELTPTSTMVKPRRPWACGEAASVSSEERKASVRTYVHKPGCRCSLCVSGGWGMSGSSGISEVSSPRCPSGLPVLPVQPGRYASPPPVRIVSSPIGPHSLYRYGGGGTAQVEPSADVTYDSHVGGMNPSGYYDSKPLSGTASSVIYPGQQLPPGPSIQVMGGGDWQHAKYVQGTPQPSVIASPGYPIMPNGPQYQGERQPQGTPAFAQSPASHTPGNEAPAGNAPSSPVPSRSISAEEAEKLKLQQEYKEQQEEFNRKQEELERQRARQKEEFEMERQLLKEQRERLERQREELEREKQEVLQERLHAAHRAKNNAVEKDFDAGLDITDALTEGRGAPDSLRSGSFRRQQGSQRHTTSTSNILRSITGSAVGDAPSRHDGGAAETETMDDKEPWSVTGGRHHQQHGAASRFFSRTASIETAEEKETCTLAFAENWSPSNTQSSLHTCPYLLVVLTFLTSRIAYHAFIAAATPREDLQTDPSMALSAALDKVAQIRGKLDTLQQQLEVQSHEVASYYSSLKAAEQVHGSLQQTASDCRVCYGRRTTQLQEVDKRLSVLTAQDLQPCSVDELEELAQELEGTQYKLTVVQAQRSGGAATEDRKKPKQLLPYSSSCLPEPKSSFGIPEEPVSRIGPDECVALQEAALQEIKVLAEDLEHIKSVHLQFKKAYKKLQGVMMQEVNNYDVDLQRLVAIEKNLEEKLRRLLFLNGDANYAELSDSQMQEYFRIVNQSIRKVYREIALRESGDRRQHDARSGPPTGFFRAPADISDSKYADGNMNVGISLRRDDSATVLPPFKGSSSHLAVQARPPANFSSITSTCSSVHPPYVASSKASSIATQHMLMSHGRGLPCKMTDEGGASHKAPKGLKKPFSKLSSIFETPLSSTSNLGEILAGPAESSLQRRETREVQGGSFPFKA
ncbi:hypothetical protein Efla_004859 [Eimeria flavescens]